MSISSTTRKAGPFTADGVNTSFAFEFKVFSAADVLVVQTDTSGAETTLTTGFAVALNADQDTTPGGSVNFTTAPPKNYLITLGSQVAQTQSVALTDGGNFNPTVVDDEFDRLTILVQQLAEKQTRALRAPFSDAATDLTLPTKIARASKYLAFDTNGEPIGAVDPGAYPSSAFMAGVITSANAAVARASMGIGTPIATVAAARAYDFSSTNSGDYFHTLGYYGAGDGGHDGFQYVSGAAAGTYVDDGGKTLVPTGGDGSAALVSLTPRFVNARQFGAKGDGVDDFDAMTAANEYLNSIGGGTLYWDAGHYKSPNTLKSLIPYPNIEYCGDGYGSFLDFAWNAFNSKNYLNALGPFGRGVLPTLTYYAASDIAIGDQKFTATTPTDAGNFAVGDIVLGCSTAKLVSSSSDWQFYFMEVNRVTGVDTSTGIISLEYPIEDSCVGVQLANVTQWAHWDFKIHDLRIVCDQANGSQPITVGLRYNAHIWNLHTEGAHVLSDNGVVRSTYRNSVAIAHVTSGNTTPRVAETAIGSLNSVVRGLDTVFVNDDGTDVSSTWVPIIPDEFSRRCTVEDVSVHAPGIDCLYLVETNTDGAHLIRNIRASLKSVNQIYRNMGYGATAVTSSILDKSTDVDGVHLQTQNGYTNGIILSCASPALINGSVRNITHSSINAFSPSSSVYLDVPLTGYRMSGVSLEGPIVTTATFQGAANDFRIEDSDVQGFDTVVSLNATGRRNLTRKGQEYVLTQTNADTHLQTTTANNKVTSFILPANSLVFEGDYWDIQADIEKNTGASAATVAIVVFGTTVATISIAASTATNISIRGRVFLSGGTGFTAPGTANVRGYYVLNGAVTNFGYTLTFTGSSANEIDIEAWLASSGDNMDIFGAEIAFVPVESR